MAFSWDIIRIKSIPGINKVTEEQKNSTIWDAVSKWGQMGLSQQQIAYGIAVMGVESAFNSDAQSITGPCGLGQFSADTWIDAVKEYNTKYGGNLDPNLKNTDADPATQIAVLGAWTSKIWTKAEEYANDPMFKGYSVEEIAYGLHHQSYFSSKKTILRFLRDTGFNGYNNSNIKGYFNITDQTANNILSGFYAEGVSWADQYWFGPLFNPQLFFQAEITRSPVALDLDGDGVETTALSGGAYFDHDGNSFAEQTGWIKSDDGLLVRDINSDGIINDGKELFGDQTLLSNGQKAQNGFQALADLDDNHDGKIDSSDAAYSQLKVWQDIDGDGYSTPGELFTLNELGIESINTGYTSTNITDANGNTIKESSTFTSTDGTTGNAADVWFKTDNMYTIAEEWLDVPEEITTLPDLQGYGNVYDLHQAMVRDTSGQLKSLIEQFAAETDTEARHALMTQILYHWAGVENVDPLSRAARIIYGNAIGDARKLATLEAFMGEPYLGTWCWGERDPNPHGPASKKLLLAFDELSDSIYSQLMAQTHFKPLMDSISMTWNPDTDSIEWDVSATGEALQTLYIADPNNAPLAISEFADVLKNLPGTPGCKRWKTCERRAI